MILEATDRAIEGEDDQRITFEHPTDVARGDLAPSGAIDDEPEAVVDAERDEDLDRA